MTPHDDSAEAVDVDLLFAGDVFVDVVFSGVPVPEAGTEVYADGFTVTPGGTANRAVAAARLGANTVLLSQLGDDVLGRHIRSLLADEPHLDVRYVDEVAGHQSPVTVSLTGAHDRSFITYEETIAGRPFPAGIGAVGATHVGIGSEVPEWARSLRASGTTVFGGVGWDPSGRWSPDTLDRLVDVDVFVPNDLEAMNYTGTEDARAAARALGEYVELAVVTRGPDGVVAYDASTGRFTEVPAVRVPAVDPTGAGDVFVASLMTAMRMHDWTLEQQLRFAGLCASLSVMSLGGAASAPVPSALARAVSEFDLDADWRFIEKWASAPTTTEEK